MRYVLRLWRPLSAAVVLVVLAAAVLAGLTRPGIESAGAAARHVVAPYVAPAPEPVYVEPEPAPLLAPYDARRTVASRGALAYSVVDADLAGADVPARSLAAYQRAATAIGLADRRCHLGWETLAAIGKVATDHGRAATRGPRLNGRKGNARVRDTDAGLLDGDKRFDRSVGPMLLLPATWSVVSVDGDSDGARDPEAVEDAALGVAVFLCAGPGDLRRHDRLRERVARYHAGEEFVRAVLAARRAYVAAAALPDPQPVLVRGSAPTPELPEPTATPEPSPTPGATFGPPGHQTFVPGPGSTASPTPRPSPSPTPTPTPTPSASPSPTPTDDPSPTPSVDPSPSTSPTPTPTPSPTDSPTLGGQ